MIKWLFHFYTKFLFKETHVHENALRELNASFLEVHIVLLSSFMFGHML